MKKSLSTFLVVLCLLVFIAATFYLSKKSELSYPLVIGNWSRCIEGQLKQSYTLGADGSYSRKKYYYIQKNGCEGPLSYTHSLEGSYKINHKRFKDHNVELDLNITTQKVSLKIAHKDTVDVYNERTVCEINDWKKGKERNITGIQVDDCSQYKAGTITYRTFRIQGDFLKISNKSFSEETRSKDFKPGLYVKNKDHKKAK